MKDTENINTLLDKATKNTKGGHVSWYKRVPSDAQPFVDELQNRVVNEGVKANARVVADILANEYDFVVSYSRVRSWLAKLEQQHAEKNG